MNIQWRDAARHYLQVVAFCCGIAVLTTLMGPNRSYPVQLVYSVCIGTICWAFIESGRLLVNPAHCYPSSHGDQRGWPKGWRGALLIALGILAGFYLGDWLAYLLVGPADPGRPAGARDSAVGLYITVAAGVVGSFYFHAKGRGAVLAAQLAASERAATEAKLKLLDTQLEPHMLFNTLANLRALITLDPPRAVAMLDHLNSYLRTTLAGSRTLAHPLAAEFDRLGDYLELMSVRMGERLRYTLELPEALRSVPVPPLLLQPLVENAIRHGLEPKVEGGCITVRASRRGDDEVTGSHAARGLGSLLVVEVIDTGAGLPPAGSALPQEAGRGFGLAQVRERLAGLYGARGALELIAVPEGGTCARVTFPLKIET